ncbi:hypothetical protein HN014_21120 [Aquimarina sp. TRL1]|uniref:contractile injection system tape measure protein n=1 Tax=Aquimarina sp. (strain TRL1) TaxID=2736252 RepID=UPI00158995F9|nr:contractile injection system tape measure protein [Aquimarina sp. TRL1]QKX07305.1 hypothetical protein HN014_21120 [Aquimarina sp. TRL1]
MNPSTHIIQKLVVEVTTSEASRAYVLQKEVDVLVKEQLIPAVQTYLDSMGSTVKGVMRFDTVQLVLEKVAIRDTMQCQLQLVKALGQRLQTMKNEGIQEKRKLEISIKDTKKDALFFFLKTGRTPWWDHSEKGEFLNQKYWTAMRFSVKDAHILKQMMKDDIVRKRLDYQLSIQEKWKLLSGVLQLSPQLTTTFYSAIKNTFVTTQWQKDFIEALLAEHLYETASGSPLKRFWERYQVFWHKKKAGKEALLQEVVNALGEGKVIHLTKSELFTKIKKQLEGSSVTTSIRKDIASNIIKEYKQKVTKVFIGIRKYNTATSAVAEEVILSCFPLKDISQIHHFLSSRNEPCTLSEIKEIVTTLFREHNVVKRIEEEITAIESSYQNKLQKQFELETTSIRKITVSHVPEVVVRQTKKRNMLQEKNRSEIRSEFPSQPDNTVTDVVWYTATAGLVLVHPFIESLFRATGIIHEKAPVIADKEKSLAVHLLHYLATGKEQVLESEMLLAKFLCGFCVNTPIKRELVIPEEMKREADALIKSVISHWGVLKSTSVDGLREGFIQRNGKLILDTSDKYRLIVERKAQDILLDKLPWNRSIIRLPWIDKLIFVEW